MDFIAPVIDALVAKHDVSETLAAFVARMIVYNRPDEFSLDSKLSDGSISDLVARCSEFLTQKDSPSLETVHMQVAFDSAYFQSQSSLDNDAATRRKKLKELEADVCGVGPEKATDYNAMTQVYHQIFQFLTVHANADPGADDHEDVLREIAAALESVFPRVGLKSFLSLSTADKRQQLKELARLILGVRLFNRAAGKGGAGLEDVVQHSVSESQGLLTELQTQLDLTRDSCDQYSDVLMNVRLGGAAAKAAGLDDARLGRLKDELTNRRQLSAYTKSVMDEVNSDAETIRVSADAYKQELEDLKRLVGSRASVPKEQVYPKFGAMATLWASLDDHLRHVRSREAIYRALVPFQSSFTPTLTLDMVKAARQAKPSGAEDDMTKQPAQPGVAAPTAGADVTAATTSAAAADSKEPEAKQGDDPSGGGGATLTPADDGDDAPVLLSLESSPEFMQLPLEYQGYCPWTIVSRQGLLLPGDPTLGVVRYRNSFHVFTSEKALTQFMQDPRKFSDGVLTQARRSPELVHLLQLQLHFPEASLPDLVRGDAAWPGGGGMAQAHPLLASNDAGGPAVMKDAATETPTHFVEKHIDPRYEWNEWALRRKALQLADLRKSATTSTQTDGSHFRRDNTSQVFLPRAKGTNTGVSRGTNPPRVHRYITGLRGGTKVVRAGPSSAAPAGGGAGGGAGAGAGAKGGAAQSPLQSKASYRKQKKQPLAAVVKLEYDL